MYLTVKNTVTGTKMENEQIYISKLIKPELLLREKYLVETKNKKYAFLTPLEATKEFVKCYQEAHRYVAGYIKLKTSKKGIGKGFFSSPQQTAIAWRLRQLMDENGWEYGWGSCHLLFQHFRHSNDKMLAASKLLNKNILAKTIPIINSKKRNNNDNNDISYSVNKPKACFGLPDALSLDCSVCNGCNIYSYCKQFTKPISEVVTQYREEKKLELSEKNKLYMKEYRKNKRCKYEKTDEFKEKRKLYMRKYREAKKAKSSQEDA